MGVIDRNSDIINNLLDDGLRNLSPEDRRVKYQKEFKVPIIDLLKKHYTDDLQNKIIFYQDAFSSFIGIYDSELLLFNLILEQESSKIINSLIRRKTFENIVRIGVSNKLLEYIDSILRNYRNKYFDLKDEQELIKTFFLRSINEENNHDWQTETGQNIIIKTFKSWFLTNDDSHSIQDKILAFLWLTKIWNSLEGFSQPFNNKKAIIFYHNINEGLKQNLSKLSTSFYPEFITEIEKIRCTLFINLKYMPLFDTSESIHYTRGYLIQRRKNTELLGQIKSINNISESWSFSELINTSSKETTELIIRKCLREIAVKIEKSNYPTKEELFKLNACSWKPEIDKLKNEIIEKLYYY